MLRSDEESTWVHIHLDLVQWNYTYRHKTICLLNCVYNEIFGVNYYHVGMQVFASSLLASNDRFMPPGLPGNFTCWDNHAGGNQGIMQTNWTIRTQATIHEVMLRMGHQYKLIGAGDNQIFRFT